MVFSSDTGTRRLLRRSIRRRQRCETVSKHSGMHHTAASTRSDCNPIHPTKFMIGHCRWAESFVFNLSYKFCSQIFGCNRVPAGRRSSCFPLFRRATLAGPIPCVAVPRPFPHWPIQFDCVCHRGFGILHGRRTCK